MTQQSVDQEFAELTDSYRRELLAHCYRMLGSVHDAEDLVQETYLRAWRSYDGFEGRSSLRTWLYRIATNACLNALESRNRRPLPTGLGGPSADPADPLNERPELPWLEPLPDTLISSADGDPATIVGSRESVRLAFVAALQHLPARQRAVLVLRDVLKMPAAEVADVLGTSTAAVNSMLQRAHAQLDQAGLAEEDVVLPTDREQQELLERYVDALENKDIPQIVRLVTADAIWEMPPFTAWFQGPEAIGKLVDLQCPAGPGGLRLLPTRANGQPAFAMYMRSEDGEWRAFALHVLTLRAAGIAHVVAFFDLSLFATFRFPMSLPGDPVGTTSAPG